MIQACLRDAEERGIRDEGVKLWLEELRDVAYDAEDVLEEFEYELMKYHRLSGEKENHRNTHRKRSSKKRLQTQVRKISNFLLGTCGKEDDQNAQHIGETNRGLHVHQIIANIKDINNRFERIYNDREALKLGENDGQWREKQQLEQRPKTSSVLGDSHVYGRDEDRDEVIDLLLSSEPHEHGTKNVSVVAIEGMGGVGKTTLAQHVYRDARVKDHFEVMSWVCVSDSFEVVRLTKEILEALLGGTSGLQGFNPLQEKLQESLEGRRFFLVLDDLWNEDVGQWEALWKPLSNGAPGSKVLITTRNEEVSRVARATGRCYLKGLLGDDSWSLFAKYAFGDKNPNDYLNLAPIGAEIVQKCGGLPLALRALGGLLFDESDEDRWYAILKSDMWDLPKGQNDILPALKLSYRYLPSAVKPCFAFCAFFPKDFEFNRQNLVFLWMAQGYITPTTGRCMEDVGREYFDELLQRSFCQNVSKGLIRMHDPFPNDSDGFKMHDLIHDLALSVGGPECATIEDGELSKTHTSRTIRHMRVNQDRKDVEILLPAGRSTNAFQCLRTFYMNRLVNVRCVLPKDIFLRMKYLRALDLSDAERIELPDSVGNLKHLRYLRISARELTGLPETLGDLFSLQTLIVRCLTLEELPKCLTDLGNLRHLRVSVVHLGGLPGTMGNLLSLQTLIIEDYHGGMYVMPRGIGKLTQLRELPLFVVGEGTDAAGIEELRYLNDLRGTLKIVIRSLDNWVPDTEPTILIHKKGLKFLYVTFETYSTGASMMTPQEELLESIQPHTNIRQVRIDGYRGIRHPKWMGDPSYSSLEEIQLRGLGNCEVLPAFGQLPALKKLRVSTTDALTSVGPELLGDGTAANGASVFFASLEELEFSDLSKVEGLSIGTDDSIGAFPHLRSIKIHRCRKLTCVKLRHLTALESLEIEACPQLTTLDYHHNLGGSPGQLQQSADHIPNVKIIILRQCPKLNFPPAERERLPSSRSVWISNTTRNNKKYELRWDPERHKFSFTPEEAEQLLQRVRPHTRSRLPTPSDKAFLLQELLIEGYLGRRFCDWVWDPLYLPNLVKMTLSGCVHCERLPPVGLLPSLRELYISNMPELQLVGRELCIEREYNGGPAAFPELRVLTIINCPKLRSFRLLAPPDTPCGPSSSNSSALHPFPHLQLLHIQDCPELASLVGIHGISSMRVLSLVRCPSLDFSHEAQLPTGLQLANITGCPLLSGWCLGGRILHLRRLWVDETLAFSDETSITETSITECLNAMRENER